MSEIIAVSNQKGGVGKTTTAVNLSAAMAILGHKSLLIDLDPQGNATSAAGFDKRSVSPSIYNVLVDLAAIESTVKNTDIPNYSIVGSGNDLIGVEAELTGAMAKESRLRGALSSIKDRFDIIFIDCPPSLGVLTLNALNACGRVLIPIQSEYYAMEGVAQLMETIDRVKKAWNPAIEIDGLLTMYDPRIVLANQVRGELSKFLGQRLFSTMIPRNVRIAEAPSFGKSIFGYDQNSRGAAAYLELAKEMAARLGMEAAASAKEASI
jgi:chromosome partitioning protein